MATTLPELLNTLTQYAKPEFMLVKKEAAIRPFRAANSGDSMKYFSLGLHDLGQAKGDKLIILSKIAPKWVMTDFANLCLGGITVPVYYDARRRADQHHQRFPDVRDRGRSPTPINGGGSRPSGPSFPGFSIM